MANTVRYFPHIDGLRGIAVLGVLLFHLDIGYFSGGFVGVDIFFVISGYLITSHILTSLAQNDFSFAAFYKRRARRLLPALFFTLGAAFVASLLIFPASHWIRLGTNTLQALFSVANIAFWLESGYFDASASSKPLLHTWSLSVEEQFYLVWPAFLLLLGTRRYLWLGILLAGMLSLLLSEYWLSEHPAMVFFLMPFRIVEFSLGALLCWLEIRRSEKQGINDTLTILGLVLAIAPFFLYDAGTRFPGLSAVLPCLGAALLIHAGGHSRLGSLLQSRTLLFFGLISYSLYLVHWPLVVFYKYTHPNLDLGAKLLLFAFSIAAAVLMYQFVETPFRKRRGSPVFPRPQVAGAAAVIILGLAWPDWGSNVGTNLFAFSGAGVWTLEDIETGKNHRFDILNRLCNAPGAEGCLLPSSDKSSNVLILGDSHAPDALNMFSQAFPAYHYVMHSLDGGCPPMVDTDSGLMVPQHPNREQCIVFNREIFNADFLKDYDTIIINVFFSWYQAEHLAHTVASLHALSDANIIVLGNYIALTRDMADLHNQGLDPRQHPEFVESFAIFEQDLAALAPGNFFFLSKKELFCDGDAITQCQIIFEGAPFAYDQHHLSLEASTYAANKLQERFNGDLARLLPPEQ